MSKSQLIERVCQLLDVQSVLKVNGNVIVFGRRVKNVTWFNGEPCVEVAVGYYTGIHLVSALTKEKIRELLSYIEPEARKYRREV